MFFANASFPDISPSEWETTHKVETTKGECSCGVEITADVPFYNTEIVGFTSKRCVCGAENSVITYCARRESVS